MLEGYNQGGFQQEAQMQVSRPKKVLRMLNQNSRMAGSQPVWEKPVTAQQNVEQRLSAAATGQLKSDHSFETALSYADASDVSYHGDPDHEFGIGDVVDMVNPLHHVPVVGHIYRELTGDDIKPIARIVGGSVFGGPIGAAGSLANVIVQEETGKDITETAMAVVIGNNSHKNNALGPEQRLNQAAKSFETGTPRFEDMNSIAAFADLSHQGSARAMTGNMTGSLDERIERIAFLPPREPITELIMSDMQAVEMVRPKLRYR